MIGARTAVWLDVEIETLADRVARGSGRPLLNGKDSREALRALAEARNPSYAEAHLTIKGGDSRPEATVERIVQALAAR